MMKVVLLLFFMLTGCSALVSNPEVTVTDVSITGLDAGGVSLDFSLAVTNPNAFQIKLLSYDYHLAVMGVPLADGGARPQLDFPAKATTGVTLPVHMSFKDMIQVVNLNHDTAAVPYQLKAGFDLGTPVGAIFVPVEKKGTYAIPEKYRPSSYLKVLSGLLGGLQP